MAALTAGSLLGRYRLISLLGLGAMGSVWRAERLSDRTYFALKLVSEERAGDEASRRRALREARLAQQVIHPHAVPVLDAGEQDGVPYLVMELVDGTDLAALLADGPIHPAHAVEVAAQIADALEALAERGLLHRDVKPSNILIRGAEATEALLTDFGLCRATDSLSGLTLPGQWLGTLDYCSPEQLEAREVDPRTDIYGLGCVLYEALTGSVPFPRAREVEKMLAHLSEPPPPPSEHGAPAALDAVVARSMAKDPDERYPGGREMAAALREAASGLGAAPEPLLLGRSAPAPAVGRDDETVA